MTEKPSSAVPRLDAAIAALLASLVPIGALALVSAIPAVESMRGKEQIFIWWAFEAAALFLVGVAFGVVRHHEGAAAVRLRSIFLLPSLYSAIWIIGFILLAIASGDWGGPLDSFIPMIGLVLGAAVGAAFAALVAIRPTGAISRRRAIKLGALSAVPSLVLFATWFAGDRLALAGRPPNNYGVVAGLIVIVVLLSVACAAISAPLLRLLTMPSDRS